MAEHVNQPVAPQVHPLLSTTPQSIAAATLIALQLSSAPSPSTDAAAPSVDPRTPMSPPIPPDPQSSVPPLQEYALPLALTSDPHSQESTASSLFSSPTLSIPVPPSPISTVTSLPSIPHTPMYERECENGQRGTETNGTPITDVVPRRPMTFWQTVMDNDEQDAGDQQQQCASLIPTPPQVHQLSSSPPGLSQRTNNGDDKDIGRCAQQASLLPAALSTREQQQPTPENGGEQCEGPNLMNIVRTHRKEWVMPFQCQLCRISFRKVGHLNMHWRSVHPTLQLPEASHNTGLLNASASAPPSTDSGGSSVSTSENYSRTAQGERPYNCPQCPASFRRGSDRNRHMRMVHARVRPHACPTCAKRFGRRTFMEAHLKTVHQKARPYKCFCGSVFGQRSSLTRHARRIHGTEPERVTGQTQEQALPLPPPPSQQQQAQRE